MRASIRKVPSGPGFDPWRAYIEPRGPQDYDGGDPEESPVLAPYGGSYWPTWSDALTFVCRVLREQRP